MAKRKKTDADRADFALAESLVLDKIPQGLKSIVEYLEKYLEPHVTSPKNSDEWKLAVEILWRGKKRGIKMPTQRPMPSTLAV